MTSGLPSTTDLDEMRERVRLVPQPDYRIERVRKRCYSVLELVELEKQPVDAIVVVNMQVGLLNGAPKDDLQGVIQRINLLTAMVRKQSGKVIWIRHCGKTGDGFERHTEGWSFLPELSCHRDDVVIEKTLNDPFVGTPLQETLRRIGPDRVLVAGWATDLCVDATIRSAVSNDYHVVVVSDGHTLSDRPHLDAATVIRHHHWVWGDLITNRSVRIVTTGQLIDESAQTS